MIGSAVSIFDKREPARPLALVADATSCAEQTRKALLSCGASPVMLGGSAENELVTRSRHADLLVIDLDFGGRRKGLRLVEAARRRSRVPVILVGADVESATESALAHRCHLLHRPVHDGQLRTTIRLALAQRPSDDAPAPAEARHFKLEQALRQIDSVVRSLTGAEHPAAPQLALDELRPRERQIVDLLLEHHRAPAIAVAMGISPHTVRNHLKNIYRRLGVHSQQELLLALKQDDN